MNHMGAQMVMTPEQLQELEKALRRKWELERESDDVSRTIECLKAGLLVSTAVPVDPANSKQAEEGSSLKLKNAPLPERVTDYLRMMGKASVQDVIAALAPEEGNAVRSAISRLVKRGGLIAQQTNEDGVPIRGAYVYIGGDK